MLSKDAATRLADARERKLMSQEQLAAASGVSVYTISSIESGRHASPYRRTIYRLAQALGIDPDDLFESEVAS